MQRVEILRDLRLGKFDCLVGINLLREGLDLPEVSLVAILDADKEGFLRSDRSLIQTMGRAARHLEGKAILYADRRTDSMQRALAETGRRRARQLAYNAEHGITPQSIKSSIKDALSTVSELDYYTVPLPQDGSNGDWLDPEALPALISRVEKEMRGAASKLEFERAAELRDQLARLRNLKPGEMLGQAELYGYSARPDQVRKRGSGKLPRENRGQGPRQGARR
jgi:excinuclease ABC subunit B